MAVDTQPPTATPPADDVLLTWQAPAAPVNQRSPRWYLIGSVIVLLVAAYGIITGSWTLAVVAVLCGAIYVLLRNHQPPTRTIAILRDGVLLDTTFYRWDTLRGFWFIPGHDYIELRITPLDGAQREQAILTGTVLPADIRLAMSPFVPELSDKQESILDSFIRFSKL